MILLEVEKLSYSLGEAETSREISLCLRRGDLLQVIGKNGAGKTSLLRVILGLRNRLSGEIRYSFQRVLGSTIGYLPQNSEDTLLPWLTAEENIWLGLVNAKCINQSSIFYELTTSLGDFVRLPSTCGKRTTTLTNAKHDNFAKMPANMSGGERQKTAILRSLIVGGASMLALDEPFRELDHDAVKAVASYVTQFAESGGAVIYISHQDTALTPTARLEL